MYLFGVTSYENYCNFFQRATQYSTKITSKYDSNNKFCTLKSVGIAINSSSHPL
jgi:hypothetical protein